MVTAKSDGMYQLLVTQVGKQVQNQVMTAEMQIPTLFASKHRETKVQIKCTHPGHWHLHKEDAEANQTKRSTDSTSQANRKLTNRNQ